MTWIKRIVGMIRLLIQGKNVTGQTQTALKVLVDSIIPGTYDPAGRQASFHTSKASVLHVDEYQIYILNHYLALNIIFDNANIYLANATAKLLDAAAKQLISQEGNEKPVNQTVGSDEGLFAALAAPDRCRAINLLEQLQVDLATLPVPFCNNSGAVMMVVSILTMLTVAGYYSEWSGYGSTRREPPETRKIDHLPPSWDQIGYPGPAKGYHALRTVPNIVNSH